jgi:hypothetical protein
MRVFDPWVGSKYWSAGYGGVRVLILGESHYGDIGTESATFTTEVVKKWGQDNRLKFFTTTQMLVAGIGKGKQVTGEQRAAFWEQVAFYNFVQAFTGQESRCRPTPKMWADASPAFLATIAELKPQVVVVLGLTLRRHLPAIPENIHVCFAQHPSSRGFNLEEWQPAIQAAIKKAAEGDGS